MKKLIVILVFISALFNFSGCAVLRGKVSKGQPVGTETVSPPARAPVSSRAHRQIPSLTESDKAALVLVGFDLLEDRRPQMDISYMTSIRERVSSEILAAIRSVPLFDEVHFPPAEDDSVIVSGEIRKFNWQYYNTMISYIPGLNVLPFLGLTSTRTRADVEIYLELKNRKTNQIVLNINESFIKNNSYNIYSFNPDRANSELASCFDVVLNRIKDKILLNKNKILEAAKIESSKTSKSAEDKKPVKDTKPTEEAKPLEETKTQEETRPAVEIKPKEETKPTIEIKPVTETNPSADSTTINPQEGQNPEVK